MGLPVPANVHVRPAQTMIHDGPTFEKQWLERIEREKRQNQAPEAGEVLSSNSEQIKELSLNQHGRPYRKPKRS